MRSRNSLSRCSKRPASVAHSLCQLGKSKGWVTQLLDGEANKTIRTIADAFAVLGQEYCSFYRPIRIGSQCAPPVSESCDTAESRAQLIIRYGSSHFKMHRSSASTTVSVERKPKAS